MTESWGETDATQLMPVVKEDSPVFSGAAEPSWHYVTVVVPPSKFRLVAALLDWLEQRGFVEYRQFELRHHDGSEVTYGPTTKPRF